MVVYMRDSKIKVGLVGFGYWGPKLLRNFSEMPGATLAWCADLDPLRLVRAHEPVAHVLGEREVEVGMARRHRPACPAPRRCSSPCGC